MTHEGVNSRYGLTMRQPVAFGKNGFHKTTTFNTVFATLNDTKTGYIVEIVLKYLVQKRDKAKNYGLSP